MAVYPIQFFTGDKSHQQTLISAEPFLRATAPGAKWHGVAKYKKADLRPCLLEVPGFGEKRALWSLLHVAGDKVLGKI